MPVRRNIKQEAQDAIDKGIVESEWEYIYGTKHQGNLPWKRKFREAFPDDVEWVGYSWAPCPYSTQSNDERTENMTGHYLDPYEQTPSVVFDEDDKASHLGADGKIVYMERRDSNSFICNFNNCPYGQHHGEEYIYS